MARPTKKRLIILDSHALLHRAYHAIPGLVTSSGEPTGALFGLTSFLLRATDELKPDFLVATRDLPGGTFRHKQYAEYKGTRGESDHDLITQLERAPQVFEAFGVPIYSAPGFEADDCIGTIVHTLQDRHDIEIVIATGDMDTLQLVRDGVSVFTLRKGITDTILYDTDRVKERYGFGPEHVIDYKALRGDPSDNIPGIKGIGEKTATEIIESFGSVDHIYTTLETRPQAFEKAGIKPRIMQLLADGKDAAYLSRELATINHEAPIDFTIPASEWRISEHVDSIEALCDRYEFTSLKKRIPSLALRSAKEEPLREVETTVRSIEDTESAIALWLLHSDLTDPSVEDILAATKTSSMHEAYAVLMRQLKDTGRLHEVFETIECPLIPIVECMHTDGIAIDVEYLQGLSAEYTSELRRIEQRIYEHAKHEFNIGSPKQLAVVLYDELSLIPEKQKKTATGARTTREEELLKMRDMHPIIADILAYRELSKLLSTYIDKIPTLVSDDGRLHARFIQTGTTTGRMASADPNLQNIPIKTAYGKRIRSAFCAAPGYMLLGCDYSQIELRIAAALSGDETLIDVFRTGGDVHAAVASQVFGVPVAEVTSEMRRKAKVINFGILYGMGANALKENLGGDTTRVQAAEFLNSYFKQFPKLRTYIDTTIFNARERGYTETLFGRRRYFPGFKSHMPGVVAQAERMAINAPIQGTQADIIKHAMAHIETGVVQQYDPGSVRLLLQVHDELIYEVRNDLLEKITADIRTYMQGVMQAEHFAGVPLVVDAAVGENWGVMKEVDVE